MKAATVALLAGAAGCADPVVQMSLRISPEAESFDISCVTTVEVYTDGGDFPGNSSDYIGKQVMLTAPPMSYDDLHNSVRNGFDLPIPSSGLSAIEIYGWSGASGFSQPAIPPDLLFYGSEPYIGQDTMQITVVPNVSCTKQPLKVRPIDILKLTTSNAATTADRCAAAKIDDAAVNAGVSFGTLSQRPVTNFTDYWGGLSGAGLVGGVATATGPTVVASESCLAFNAGMDTDYSVSCASAGKGVCGLDGEFEAAVLDKDIAFNSLVQPYAQQYKGAVFIGVWHDNVGTKTPLAGAKITLVNPDSGTVVYAEPDASVVTGTGKLVPIDGGTATGASGLAMVYTNEIVDITITAGNLTKGLRVGAANGLPSAALVVMN